jgi:hypothetical protein
MMLTMVKSSPEETSDSHRFRIAVVLSCPFLGQKTEDKDKVCHLLVIPTGQGKTKQILVCLVVFCLVFYWSCSSNSLRVIDASSIITIDVPGTLYCSVLNTTVYLYSSGPHR